MNKTKRLVFMSIMVTYSLVLYFVEAMLPSLYFITPGAKLGLSNIITMVILYAGGFNMAITVLLIRIILSSIFGGGFSAFLYSVTGGIFSLVAMWAIKSLKIKSVSEVGVSVVGAVFFNVGQLLAAAIMINNLSIFIYLPIMCYVSIGTGILVGYTAKFLNKKIPKIV